MFEPLRLAFFTLGLLIVIGAMIYGSGNLDLPGGFADLTGAIVVIYWFVVIISFIIISFSLIFKIIEMIKLRGKPVANMPQVGHPMRQG